MFDVYRGERTLVGVNTSLYGVEEFAGELRAPSELFDGGKLKTEGEWTQVKLEDGFGAYEMAGEKGAGKFVIVME
jgi:hypothetical protein